MSERKKHKNSDKEHHKNLNENENNKPKKRSPLEFENAIDNKTKRSSKNDSQKKHNDHDKEGKHKLTNEETDNTTASGLIFFIIYLRDIFSFFVLIFSPSTTLHIYKFYLIYALK